jgi:hypothetical protein
MSLNQETQNNLIVTQSDKFNSTFRSRNLIETPDVYTEFPPIVSLPLSLKMDFDRILNKPFLIDVVSWATTSASLTPLVTYPFPSFMLDNEQLRAPFRFAAKYRMKACALLQVTGTPLHQGVLLAAALPRSTVTGSRLSINSLLQAPHVFLAANEATPVCLELPFYSQTKLRNTFTTASVNEQRCPTWGDDDDYADLHIFVLNALTAGSTGASSVSVSTTVVIKQADFYVPKNAITTWTAQSAIIGSLLDSSATYLKKMTGDYIDRTRKLVKAYTGLHNPNVPTIHERMVSTVRNYSNLVDGPTYFEKLDPYAEHSRVVQEPTFYTNNDEMLISNIIQKPQYLGTFQVATNTASGTVVWSRPITPMQETYGPIGDGAVSTPLQVLSWLTMFWKGGLKVHLQSSMTNFHNVRLMLARNYSNDIRAIASLPNMYDMISLQTETVEFSEGGQVQTFSLPYCSELEQLPHDYTPGGNAVSHGMYYIYLVQPLTTSASVATSVNFNVFVSADVDFNFYGYSRYPLKLYDYLNASESDLPAVEEESDFIAQSTMVEPSSQEGIVNPDDDGVSHPTTDRNFRPVISLRDFQRRFMYAGRYQIWATTNLTAPFSTININVATMLSSFVKQQPVQAQRIVRQFFFGQTGGLKFKFVFQNAQDSLVRYIPAVPFMSPASLPPTIYRSFTSANSTSYNDDLYARLTYPNYADALSGDMYTYPIVETSSGSKPTGYGSGDTLVNCNIIELEIPMMNCLEFLGGADNFKLASPAELYCSSGYGTFNISARALHINGGLVTDYKPEVTVYVCYADESRLGFNTFAPAVKPITFAGDSPRCANEGFYIPVTGAPLRLDVGAALAAYIGT